MLIDSSYGQPPGCKECGMDTAPGVQLCRECAEDLEKARAELGFTGPPAPEGAFRAEASRREEQRRGCPLPDADELPGVVRPAATRAPEHPQERPDDPR